MSTQEKLVMELVDEICDYDEYCGNENCNKCGGAIKHWKKKLTALIESAKREGYNDAIMFARKCCAGGQNCDYEALIKQSEESE